MKIEILSTIGIFFFIFTAFFIIIDIKVMAIIFLVAGTVMEIIFAIIIAREKNVDDT